MILETNDSDGTKIRIDTEDGIVAISVGICQYRGFNGGGKNPFFVQWETKSGGNNYAFFKMRMSAHNFEEHLKHIQAWGA